MLKCLAIFALWTSLQASAPVPGQTVKPAAQSGGQNQKQGEGNHSSAAPAFPHINKPVQPGAANSDGSEVADKDKQNTVTLTGLPPVTVTPITIVDKQKTFWDHMLDWGPWIFDALLAVAAGLQVWLLKRTWKEIHRQANTMDIQVTEAKVSGAETLTAIKEQNDNLLISAKAATVTAMAAQKSADAAQATVKAMEKQQRAAQERERARIVVKIIPDKVPLTAVLWQIKFRVENIGPTHAFDVLLDARVEFSDSPVPPAIQQTAMVGSQKEIRAGKWRRFLTGPMMWGDDEFGTYEAHMHDVLAGRTFMHMRGNASYKDIFGDPHVTPFRYLWNADVKSPFMGKPDPMWYPAFHFADPKET